MSAVTSETEREIDVMQSENSTQQADALVEKAVTRLNRELPGSCYQLHRETNRLAFTDAIKIISTTCHLPELLALEEAVRKDHGGKNVRAHCKICHALAALDAAKRKEEV